MKNGIKKSESEIKAENVKYLNWTIDKTEKELERLKEKAIAFQQELDDCNAWINRKTNTLNNNKAKLSGMLND